MVTYLGSLVQLCHGEGGTLQTNMAGMCRAGSAHSVWTTQGFLKLMGACAFLVYTAQVASFSEGVLSKMGPSFSALPRSKLLRCRFLGTPQRRRLG